MKVPDNTTEKMNAAFQLLQGPTLSYDTFHHVHTLIKGIHPGVDEKLELCEKALHVLQKVQQGDVITLSAENLPEETDSQKKRKKALLFFITNIKSLQSEIKRVNTEFSQENQSSGSNAWHFGRIIKYAKGPFGLITLAAVIIVGIFILTHKRSSVKIIIVPQRTFQVITYNGHQIPLNQLRTANAHFPGCDARHYHALSSTETVTALDGTTLLDPGGCGFGKVQEMQITTVSQ